MVEWPEGISPSGSQIPARTASPLTGLLSSSTCRLDPWRSRTVSSLAHSSGSARAHRLTISPNLDDPSPSLRPHYQASPLLRDGPPLCLATGTQPLEAHHLLEYSLSPQPPGRVSFETTGSHVPCGTPDQTRATYMPDTAWAVSRYPPDSSQSHDQTPVLMPSKLSTLPQWFAYARLPGLHLTRSRHAVSASLTTPALNRRSMRWLEGLWRTIMRLPAQNV